jgi:dolichol-phosphate mannosyltransferase
MNDTNAVSRQGGDVLGSYYESSISNNKVNSDSAVNHKHDFLKNLNDPISVCIVVPTYNEVHNILKLLNLIYSEKQQLKYSKHNITMKVLVVDDSSPDGTANLVKLYQTKNKNVYLLLRSEKNGLGAAYVAGMQHAMKLLHPDIVFEMDADLSHNPKYILPMINKIKEGADFVIGSRYVKGGAIPDNWGFTRKLISRSANIYAKTVLNIKSVNDCTGGFRAIRYNMLEQINLDGLDTKGYAFQISLLEEMRRHGAIMKEVPIHFKDRTNGQSKMRMYDIIEEGIFVFKTRLKNMVYSKRYAKEKEQRNKVRDST